MTQENVAFAISELRQLLGERLSTGASVREMHGRDEAYSDPALPDAVVFPESTAEVSSVMQICHSHRVPVIPFGIGTSLEGHVIPIHGGVSIDTSRMNRVLEIHEADMDAVVQPGVSRSQLNEELRATGLIFTVDPGADATLGGMAATRASGTNTVRYGTMRENTLALEVVLPDGTIIRTGTRARKSASGYDLTHLFVGSEGTLGIITELTVRLVGQPEAILAATCAFESLSDAVNAVILAIQLGIPMARIELLDELQMKGMTAFNPDMDLPIKPHLFLEFHGSNAGVLEQVEQFKHASAEVDASDFKWADKAEDRNRLWQARHNALYAAKALRPGCETLVTDCCVPISALAECISRAREMAEQAQLIAPIVGHVGDGNFHMLVLVDPESSEEIQKAKHFAENINRLALSFDGTITGEHGVGIGKKAYMQSQHGEAYHVMAALKRSLDPANIMNPGKLVTIN